MGLREYFELPGSVQAERKSRWPFSSKGYGNGKGKTAGKSATDKPVLDVVVDAVTEVSDAVVSLAGTVVVLEQ